MPSRETTRHYADDPRSIESWLVSAGRDRRAGSPLNVPPVPEHAWTHAQSPDFPEFMPAVLAKVLELYFREHYADAIPNMSAEDRTELEHATAELHQLVAARIVEGRLEIGVTLSEDVVPIKSIQPAPDHRSVAFVTLDEKFLSSDAIARLHVVPIEASARPKLVGESIGEGVDWSADSRMLFSFDENGWNPNIGRFGSLARRTVVDPTGTLVKPDMPICLSYVIFEPSDHFAALRDGRVLFESMSITLPSDYGHMLLTFEGPEKSMSVQQHRRPGITHQLFVLTPQADVQYPMLKGYPVTPVVPEEVLELEGGVRFFDLSPDRTRVIYSTDAAEFHLLTLADGRTESIPLGLQGEYIRRDAPRAVWSGPDAFTYVKKIDARNEFVVRRGTTETILSRTWPKEMLWPYPPNPPPARNAQAPTPSAARAEATRR
jgi:hypothetical protein